MRRSYAIALSLALLAAAAYWPVVGAEFIGFDDGAYVAENQMVGEGLTPAGIRWAFTTFHANNWHPLTWLTYMAVVQIFGLAPIWFHLLNLLLHAVASGLLFLALEGMTGARWPSAATAALFAVHPLHVESVAWVSETKDVLAGVGFMLTLLAYVGYCRRPSAGRLLGLAAVFAASLLAKPMAVTFPFVLLLLDVWPLGRMGRGGPLNPRGLGRLLLEKIPLMILSLGAALLTWEAQSRGAMTSAERIGLGQRLANALNSYLAYLWKMLWPVKLAMFYPHTLGDLPPWRVAGSAALLLLTTAVCILFLRRRPYLAVGWFWYLGMLVPVIGLVQVGLQGMADRYTYLPLIGIFMALSWAAGQLAPRWRPPLPVAASAVGAMLAILTGMTMVQASYWRDNLALFGHSVEAVPDSWVAYANLGLAHLSRGETDKAVELLRTSLRFRPEYPRGHFFLGNAYRAQGKLESAVAEYRAAVRLVPHFFEANTTMGRVLADLGRHQDAAEAYARALRYKPDYAPARFGNGDALMALGRADEALVQYGEGVKLRPSYAGGYNSLGNALASRKRFPEASAAYRKAIELDPSQPGFWSNLGVLLYNQGRSSEARTYFQEALRRDPGNAEARMNLSLVEELIRKGPGAGTGGARGESR